MEVATLRHKPTGRVLYVAKGLLNKILNTGDGGGDGGPRQWECLECGSSPELVKALVEEDEALAKDGYKTIAIAIGFSRDFNPADNVPMHFVGILPMSEYWADH
jgi:hypothetical protein